MHQRRRELEACGRHSPLWLGRFIGDGSSVAARAAPRVVHVVAVVLFFKRKYRTSALLATSNIYVD
jgi:hypothetical protein